MPSGHPFIQSIKITKKVSSIIDSCVTDDQINNCMLWIERIKDIDDWTRKTLIDKADLKWGQIVDKKMEVNYAVAERP